MKRLGETDLKKEELKQQLLNNIDSIIDVVFKGNAAEVRMNKDGILIYEICRKKFNIKSEK